MFHLLPFDLLYNSSDFTYNRLILGFSEDYYYISPEQFEEYEHKSAFSKVNNEKSNVFILAHIVLECCLLEKVSNLFDYDTFYIN